ncbi:penicillin-binding protein 1C [Methylorubrum thiocyanatum]|uniref:peptidoglycan glycosyltransferase n=1 Tax=Methylorubrum thiocyanatum TaxID=47958 RepID=A0AA40S536_9HYPH|nr:penicillin-binding protein 1C [Methylorubrum thiocyanatum]MBA8914751.1 penicillin-binding protein 1C [Methylorubrum thiocyanatum]GJE79164.1 Penicillin-binding protein 1C [Methylorubrum thiocyanatum]
MAVERDPLFPRAGRGGRVVIAFALFLIVACLPAGALWRYAASLPPLDLTQASLRSAVILDRTGQLLRPFATADGRWRLPVTADAVDPRYLAMLKAYEDRRFDSHPGLDPAATLRAAWQWLTHGRIVSGGSTLSMQVARLVEPRSERSLPAKLRQMVRAVELERTLGKSGVLDLYLALAPYGGPVEGVRAASLAYFGREPARLSFAESALLVALPQSPEARRPDRFAANARRARDRVLDIAAARGVLTADEAQAAKAEPVPVARKHFPMFAAHAAEQAHAADPETRVQHLTLDARLQASLEALAAERAAAAGPALSAAILALDNRTGAVLAHVGSAGYLDAARAGAVDATAAVRSPGSALKPFIYALAFEDGLAHPETLLDDRPARFAASYAPENFDMGFRGTVTARLALQQSLNLPAVDLLDAVGAARFVARLRGAGATILLPRDTAPGLPVALGGLGITLTDLARLYAGLARGGSVPALIRRLDGPVTAPEPERRIADPVAAWYVADILRGAPPPENALPGRISFKTGTSYGYRDAWAVGFDARVTIAVWIGRPDGASVPGLVGRAHAAPILFDAFARFGGEPEALPRPRDALVAATMALPPPLRHIRRDAPKTFAATLGVPLKIAYPPDGARVDLGIREGAQARLALKALGGQPPLTWMVDGLPVAEAMRRQSEWSPEGAGFARISVMDAAGASDSVVVRLE